MGSFQTYHKLFIILATGAISQTRVGNDVICIAEYDIIMCSCLDVTLVMLQMLYIKYHSCAHTVTYEKIIPPYGRDEY